MMMFNKVVKQFQWGNHPVRLETGEIARQAGGAALVDVDETLALATVVGAKSARPSQDFFPLTVDYIEKSYAAGRIPGGFFRREGRPSEGETLISRLIDRPLRPLFQRGCVTKCRSSFMCYRSIRKCQRIFPPSSARPPRSRFQAFRSTGRLARRALPISTDNTRSIQPAPR